MVTPRDRAIRDMQVRIGEEASEIVERINRGIQYASKFPHKETVAGSLGAGVEVEVLRQLREAGWTVRVEHTSDEGEDQRGSNLVHFVLE